MGFRRKFKSFFSKKSSHKEPVNTSTPGNETVGNVSAIAGYSLAAPVHPSTTTERSEEKPDDMFPNEQYSKRLEPPERKLKWITHPVHSGEARTQPTGDTNDTNALTYGGGKIAETISAERTVDPKNPIYERATGGIEAQNIRLTSSSNATLGSNVINTNENENESENQGRPQRFEQPVAAIFNGQQMISGGTFIQNIVNSDRRGFKLLEKRVATSAFHNSARRVDPPRCHPNTRVAIQNQIYDWISMVLLIRKTWIMWMHGAAGAGKSAIMQSIAELCEKAHIPLASFFFFRTDDTRNSMASLIATIVYQLIQNIPQAQDDIFTIIESNPLIFDQSLESQLEKLIIQPLLRVQQYLKSLFIIMIDGLDECIDRVQQAYLIKLLATISRSKRIPVVFLVASRREPQIEAAFVRKEISGLVLILPLDNSDIEQASDDIRHFLAEKFSDIKETHLLKSYLPVDWPAVSVVEEIVDKSSGQFIFASVVINYLSSPRANPSTQLDIIRGVRPRDPSSQNPFAHLDALYQHIFSQIEERNKVFDIIAFLLLQGNRSIYHTQKVLLLEDGEINALFADLTAIIQCESNTKSVPELKFLHASLPDFLLDESRSEQYHIDLDKYRAKLLCMLLERQPPSLDPLWPAKYLEHVVGREQDRLWVIQKLLREAKVSERLRRAFINFNSTFYNPTFLDGESWYDIGPDLLQSLKRLDFNDQAEAYHHVVKILAAEYAKYWPSLKDYQKDNIKRKSPDLIVCINQTIRLNRVSQNRTRE